MLNYYAQLQYFHLKIVLQFRLFLFHLQIITVIRKLCNFNAGRHELEQIDTSSTIQSRRPPREFSSSGGGSGYGGGKFARGGGGFGGGYRGGYGAGGGGGFRGE